MSRFANLEATRRWAFPGGCKCPGEPHEGGDWIRFRVELGAEDTTVLEAISTTHESDSARAVPLVAFLARAWNLRDHTSGCATREPDEPSDCDCEGVDAEVTRENIARIFADGLDQLGDWLDENVRMVTVPNGSGGRSGTGTPATARPGHKRTPRSSKS
jgi:hypothetical protein